MNGLLVILLLSCLLVISGTADSETVSFRIPPKLPLESETSIDVIVRLYSSETETEPILTVTREAKVKGGELEFDLEYGILNPEEDYYVEVTGRDGDIISRSPLMRPMEPLDTPELTIGNAGEDLRIDSDVGIGIDDPLSALHLYQDKYTLYGPNSSWGAYFQVGGNGRVTTYASIAATNGNLHLDAANGAYATYVNYYSANNTYINAAGGNVGIGTTSPLSKLSVGGSGSTDYSIYGQNTDGIGIYGYSSSASLNDPGVMGYQTNSTSGTGYAMSNVVSGVTGHVWYGNPYHFGVYGTRYDDASGPSAGVMGTVNYSNSSAPWGALGFQDGSLNEYAGYFNGNVNITGNLSVSGSIPGGSSNYIWNTTTAQSADFNITGQGKVGYLKFRGEGGSSGISAQSYAIYQEDGAWSHPYPDLRIAFHTGIKIGAHYSYNGTRFYNNSDMATQIFSIGDGDNNTRCYYDLYMNNTAIENACKVDFSSTCGYRPTEDGVAYRYSGQAYIAFDDNFYLWDTDNTGDYFQFVLNNSYPEVYGYNNSSGTLIEFRTGIYNNGGTLYNQNPLMQRSYIQNDGGSYSGYVRIEDDLHVASWIRVDGNQGLYFQSYGGGWHMTDGTYIRNYGTKPLFIDVGSYDIYLDYSAGEPTIRPSSDYWGYLGTSSYYWWYFYAYYKSGIKPNPFIARSDIDLADGNIEIGVRNYCTESIKYTVEDWGVGQLVNGEARIEFYEYTKIWLSPFIKPIVTITAMGDCKGLYVADVSAEGFTVKELMGGDSNVKFSWRLAGIRAGDEVISSVVDEELDKIMSDNKELRTQNPEKPENRQSLIEYTRIMFREAKKRGFITALEQLDLTPEGEELLIELRQ